MKRKLLFALLALASFACAQQVPPSAPELSTSRLGFPVFALNAVPVTGANIQIVGQAGQATWYIWGVANYQIGSVVSLLGVVNNAPNTLSSSNYLAIYPFYPTAAGVTVDILATQSSLQPSGSCGCAVQTSATGVVNFQSNSTSSYTVTTFNPSSFGLFLTNEVTGSGTTHLLLRKADGTLVSDLSEVGSGAITGATANGGLVVTGSTLGLLTSCSTNQVEQYNGTAWGCATIAGSGTVTGTGTAGDFALWAGSSLITDSQLSTSANTLIWGGDNGVCFNASCASEMGFRWVKYNGTSTASNGMPAVTGIQQGSVQLGNMSPINIGPAYASASGVMARVSCYNVITQAASVSSTLPQCVVTFTDAVTSTSETITFGTCVPSCTSNTVGTFIYGSVNFQPKVGTVSDVSSSGFASSGLPAMEWVNNFLIEWL